MNHNWYAVLTARVLLNPDLTDKQKLLMAVISNLQNEKGYCFSSNKYLADCLTCSEVTIRQNITTLEEKGYLGRIVKLNDKGEVEYRSLTIIEQPTPPIKNNHTPPDDKSSLPPDGIQSYNNKLLKTKVYTLFTDFDKFWNLFNYKVGKPASEKAWNKMKEHEKEKCLQVVEKWLEWEREKPWKDRLQPASFLNGKRWLDEIPVKSEVEDNSYQISIPN